MLKKLVIKNLILVDFAEIEFSGGLNIITGESGSGKSALLSALGFINGRKSSPESIRQGEKTAWVEAVFSIQNKGEIKSLLEKENISYPEDHLLTVRREISQNGKSRSFVQDELVTLPFLKELGSHLLQIADQNSHEDLASETFQRTLIDTYAEILPQVHIFSKLFQKEKELRQKLEELEFLKEKRQEEKSFLKEEIQEIEEVNVKEGEEEKLSEEHYLLAHSMEALSKIEIIYGSLKDPLLPRLSKLEPLLQQLCALHSRFQEGLQLFKNARIELEEVSHLVLQMKGAFDADPRRITIVEDRLQEIESLKKKHGGSSLQEKKSELKKRLEALLSTDENLNELKVELSETAKKREDLRKLIHEKRVKASLELQEKISSELTSLNLSHGSFHIQIEPKEDTSSGSDKITFLFSANKGQSLKTVGFAASGGELSRLLLAFQTALSQKASSQTLIFDEIDSNIGGKTAALIGEKLSALGKYSQILSVTHFVQVAEWATSHFRVQKKEIDGKITTQIEKLKEQEKEKEYTRMIGK